MTPGLIDCVREALDLGAEAVERLALALEGVDDVEGGDGLAAGMLGVADGVADDLLEEGLEDGAGLLVHEAGDALDAATTRQTADRGLRDALDVVAEHLAVTLAGATLASLATTGHDEEERVVETLGFELHLKSPRQLENQVRRSHWCTHLTWRPPWDQSFFLCMFVSAF